MIVPSLLAGTTGRCAEGGAHKAHRRSANDFVVPGFPKTATSRASRQCSSDRSTTESPANGCDCIRDCGFVADALKAGGRAPGLPPAWQRLPLQTGEGVTSATTSNTNSGKAKQASAMTPGCRVPRAQLQDSAKRQRKKPGRDGGASGSADFIEAAVGTLAFVAGWHSARWAS